MCTIMFSKANTIMNFDQKTFIAHHIFRCGHTAGRKSRAALFAIAAAAAAFVHSPPNGKDIVNACVNMHLQLFVRGYLREIQCSSQNAQRNCPSFSNNLPSNVSDIRACGEVSWRFSPEIAPGPVRTPPQSNNAQQRQLLIDNSHVRCRSATICVPAD